MHVPCDGLTELRVAAPTTGEVSSTPWAASLPVFVTVAVKVAGCPTRASSGAVTLTPRLARAGGGVVVRVVGVAGAGAPFAHAASTAPVQVKFTVTEVGGALSPRFNVMRNCGSPFSELRLRPERLAVPDASSCTAFAVSGLPLGSANVTDPWAFAGLTIWRDV